MDRLGSNFTQVLEAPAKLPGVRIIIAAYLSNALKRRYAEEQIKLAIKDSPAAAVIQFKVCSEVASASIDF